ELAALDSVVLHVGLGSGLDQVIPNGLLGSFLLLRHHGDGLILGKAGLDANAAAHAVQGAHADGVGVHALALAGLDGGGLQTLGGVLHFLIAQSEGADAGVGADIGAGVALDALGGIPSGDRHGNAALLIS